MPTSLTPISPSPQANGILPLVLDMKQFATLLLTILVSDFSVSAINLKELKELRVKLLKGLQKQLYLEAGLEPPKKPFTSRSGKQLNSADGGAIM